MDTRLIQDMVRRPGCLGVIVLATFISGAVIALLAYSFLMQRIPDPELTPTPDSCQIELTVAHDVFDEREDYWMEGVPIGELEPGIYGIIGVSGELIAIDWRGSIEVHPPTLELIDWIRPIDGVDIVSGNCLQMTRFDPVAPSLTSMP